MNENNIEKTLYFKGNVQPSIEKLPELHKTYNEFVKKMDNSDFCNSVRRYLTELDYVQQLKKFYSDTSCLDQAQAFLAKEKKLIDKLKDEFGITFK